MCRPLTPASFLFVCTEAAAVESRTDQCRLLSTTILDHRLWAEQVVALLVALRGSASDVLPFKLLA